MTIPEWLARQRRFAEFDRVAREVLERQFEESAFGLMLQDEEEAKKPAPLVTWSRIDPEKVD